MKLFSFDIAISTVLVFLVLFLSPLLFSPEIFDPMTKHFANFKLTDVGYKDIANVDIADTNIVLISTEELNNKGMAFLIAKLNDKGVKTIGITQYLQQSNSPEHDEMLQQVLSAYDNIILACKLKNYNPKKDLFEDKVSGTSEFDELAITGHTNYLVNKSKEFFTIRYIYPKLKYNDDIVSSFALKVVEKFDSNKVNIIEERNNFEETINYAGNHKNFYTISAKEFLTEDIPLEFNNKIILIGEFSEITYKTPNVLEDIYFTPMNIVYSGKSFPDMYSIEIQANMISMLLKEKYYTTVPEGVNFLVALFFCYLNMVIFSYITLRNKKLYELSNLVIFLVESISIFYINTILFHSYQIEVDFTMAIFAIALSVFVFEGYLESIKPLTRQFYYKFIKRS